jgi:hypothetical protein
LLSSVCYRFCFVCFKYTSIMREYEPWRDPIWDFVWCKCNAKNNTHLILNRLKGLIISLWNNRIFELSKMLSGWSIYVLSIIWLDCQLTWCDPVRDVVRRKYIAPKQLKIKTKGYNDWRDWLFHFEIIEYSNYPS